MGDSVHMDDATLYGWRGAYGFGRALSSAGADQSPDQVREFFIHRDRDRFDLSRDRHLDPDSAADVSVRVSGPAAAGVRAVIAAAGLPIVILSFTDLFWRLNPAFERVITPADRQAQFRRRRIREQRSIEPKSSGGVAAEFQPAHVHGHR